MMTKISYSGYRFPPEIIHQAIWLYLRFTLSFRDVEDLLAERGIVISYETVRRWVNHFGPIIAAELRKRRPKPHWIWNLDEVYGRMVYLWRAVDAEGEVLDVLVQRKYAVAPERGWSRMFCGPTAQQPSISASTTCTTAGDGRTIGPRIRISRPDGGSARCNASRARAQPRSSYQPTPPSTTLSTSNAISRQLNHTACSAPRR